MVTGHSFPPPHPAKFARELIPLWAVPGQSTRVLFLVLGKTSSGDIFTCSICPVPSRSKVVGKGVRDALLLDEARRHPKRLLEKTGIKL